jgi:Putative zinc-finger
MNASGHIDELAELYALGTLSPEQRVLVDAHAGVCETCAARLGEAEQTVANLVEQHSPSAALDRRIHAVFVPRSPSRWSALIAAAFVIGLLPSIALWSNQIGARTREADRSAAVQAMVTSHFAHSPFTPLVRDAPKAKVIYSRGGDWRFIIAQTGHPYDVAAQMGDHIISLGSLHVSGDAGELFISRAPRAQVLLLLDRARPVARVTLPYRR